MTPEETDGTERVALAPWGMKCAQTQGREHDEPEHPYRNPYQRDRDRVIHCKAFRRLEYKTQVFLNHEGDHYRTRLTHTLEVAQISRTVARALGLNEDLTEAIALAHDLGHTPFGHSGEAALREVMKDHGGFEHNSHGLRVVALLEQQYASFRGLNLTHEVREGIAKHTSRWDKPSTAEFGQGPPLLEAQAVDMADSIAYDNHDLEDGLDAGILTEEGLRDVPLWAEASQAVRETYGAVPDQQRRRETIRYLINWFATDLISNSREEIERRGISSPDQVREQGENVLGFRQSVKERKTGLEQYLFEALYRDYRVMRVTNGAKRFVRAVFTALAEDPMQLPPEYQQWAAQVGVERAVCDYVAGMTDRYAQDQYIQMFEPYQKL